MKLKTTMKLEPDIERAFEKLYQENGVTMVGEWINAEDPTELYLITGYKDEDHYKSFVESAKNNKLYIEYTKKLDEVREGIEMVNLISNQN